MALLAAGVVTVGAVALVGAMAGDPHPDLPAAFEQILPRGRIASIDDPQFVKGSEAEISSEAWVLGVVIARKAKAYSLNGLDRHEIVNDRFGGGPVAAVW
jgi:hypothetical protein